MDNLVANTMKVGGVDAAGLTIQDDTNPSDVKAGESNAEIVKFKKWQSAPKSGLSFFLVFAGLL